jgi:hypothetical protein
MSTFVAPTPKSPLSDHMQEILRGLKFPKGIRAGANLAVTPNAGYELEKRGIASKSTTKSKDGKQATAYALTASGVRTVKALRK